ncbi:MAG: amidohydrolase family protein [Solirubrobacteraceae bacterium]
MTSTALVNCQIVDTNDGSIHPEASILIEDGRIASIETGGSTPSRDRDGAKVAIIDAQNAYISPGLMNMHVHLGLSLPGDAELRLRGESLADLTLRMLANGIAALRVGVTTVRLVGEREFTDFALRSAIERGLVEGPRIFTAGHALACTGGHGHASRRAVEVDGPAGFAQAARSQIKAGADLIKVMLSGGIAGEHEGMDTPELTSDELAVTIEIAHAWGRPVTAHCGPSGAISQALELGLDGVEHGYELTPEVCSLMVDRGTWLVPTILVTRCGEFFERIGVPDWMAARSLQAGPTHWSSLSRAIEAGVRIALGTDMLPAEPIEGTVATIRELEYMVEAGMSTLTALQVATLRPAEMLGELDDLGSVTERKRADLVATITNPLEDISAFRDVSIVVKDGRVVKNELDGLGRAAS